jgi:hypothetical protein
MLLPLLVVGTLAPAQEAPRREEVLQALRKASTFYLEKAATHGAYHFAYAEDLSYGRSEAKEGPHTVEVQREGTPVVGMAYLEAYAATGDRFYLDAARATALAIVSGQHCSGGWDYFIEFDPVERKKYPYRDDGPCRDVSTYPGNPMTSLDDNETQAVMRFLARVDKALGFKDAKIHEASALRARKPDQSTVSEWRLAAALQPSARSSEAPRQAGVVSRVLELEVAGEQLPVALHLQRQLDLGHDRYVPGGGQNLSGTAVPGGGGKGRSVHPSGADAGSAARVGPAV